jgi:NADH:ubiquinone oxidoreductase subunit E
MSHTQTVPFRLVGQLGGYTLGRRGKIRRLLIETSQGIHSVKLNPDSRIELLRRILSKEIQQGSWLELAGFQKIDRTGKVKSLKAQRIASVFAGVIPMQPVALLDEPSLPQDRKAKILICQKSDCCKRGSAKLQRAIEVAIGDRDLGDQVCVKVVGCLKHCSKGPNIVIDKKRYADVDVKEVELLLDRHFAPINPERIPAA